MPDTDAPRAQLPRWADQGTWLVLQQDELVATFFLPLPEPIALPQGLRLPSYVRMEAGYIENLNNSGLEFTLVPLDSGNSGAGGDGQGIALTETKIQNWSNKVMLSSSVLVFHVSGNPWSRSGLDAAFVVAREASAGRIKAESLSLSTEEFVRVDEILEGASAHGVGQVTVLEVAVRLRMLGALPQLPEVLKEPADPPGVPVEARLSPYSWPYKVAAEGAVLPLNLVSERIYNALDSAIEDIRTIQRAYYAITRHPTTLVTRTRLPSLLPVAIRRFRDIGKPDGTVRSLIWTNDNLWGVLRPSDLSREDLKKVSFIRKRIDERSAFVAHMDLYREADVALRRNGDTRLSSLLFGLAAESLLDDLLLHLQWEEKLTPEEASAQWIEGLDARVRRMYAERLGGDWNLGGKGPIGSWSRDVAELRHRVAHGGYEPSRDEAETSARSTANLITYLCDRLCAQSVLRRYPRTALALAGQPGLRQRNVYSNRLRALENDPNEPPWDETFARWRDTHRRIRRDALAVRRVPSEQDAYLLAVYRNTDLLYWCLHDRATSLATRVRIGEEGVPEELRGHLEYVLAHTASMMGDDPYSIAVDRSFAVRWEHIDPWVEEYHLVPRAGVMVDRSDFDRPS